MDIIPKLSYFAHDTITDPLWHVQNNRMVKNITAKGIIRQISISMENSLVKRGPLGEKTPNMFHKISMA